MVSEILRQEPSEPNATLKRKYSLKIYNYSPNPTQTIHPSNNKEAYIDPEHQRTMTNKALDNNTTCTNLHDQEGSKDINMQENYQMDTDIYESNQEIDDNQYNERYNHSTTSSLTSINTGSMKMSKAQGFAEKT